MKTPNLKIKLFFLAKVFSILLVVCLKSQADENGLHKVCTHVLEEV